MKQALLSFLMALLPLAVAADAVEIGGIYYNLLSKFGTAEVTSNPNKYRGVVVIPEIVSHNDIPYPVTSIGEKAFYQCPALTSITIPNSVISIENDAFQSCAGLTSVIIPNSVTSIGENVFAGCTNLLSVAIGNSVTRMGYGAFSQCNKLTNVSIPSSVTEIGSSVFSECIGLLNICIPNSVTSIGGYAFSGCTNLTNIVIPNSVTFIGPFAFQNCDGLTTITIGSNVTKIYVGAFSRCRNLTDVFCYAANVPSMTNTKDVPINAFEGSYIEYATLHIPAESLNEYNSTAPWNGFKNVVPIEDVIMEKCKTPTISYKDGKLKFGCETEGVEYVYEVTISSKETTAEDEVELKPTFRVTVYAQKAGFVNSDAATTDITVSCKPGDTDGDGEVNAVDLTKLIEILLKR